MRTDLLTTLLLAPMCGAAAANNSAALQGPPVSAASRTAGMLVRELQAGSATAQGAPMATVLAPPGSIYFLDLEALPPGVLDFVFAVPGLGPVCETFPGSLFPANAYFTDPAGAPVGTIGAAGFQNLNLAFVLPPGFPALPVKFMALVLPPAAPPTVTNGTIRLIQPAPFAVPSVSSFAPSGTIAAAGLFLRDVEQGDVDGDGDMDTLLVPATGAAILLRQTLGVPLPSVQPFTPSLGTTAELADFDNDGWLDLAIGSQSSGPFTHLTLYRNSATAPWTGFTPVPLAAIAFQAPIANVNDLETGDSDLDGFVDIALACGSNPLTGEQNRLFLNLSAPGAIAMAEVTTPSMPILADDSEDLEFSDFDLDGDLDLVVGNFDGPAPITGFDFVLINAGLAQGGALGTYVLPVPNPIPPLNDETLDVCVGDFNGDGLPDVYVGNWLVSAQIGGTTVFGPGAVIDRLLLNGVGTPPGVFTDFSLLLPDNPAYAGATPFGPWLAMDAEAFDYDSDGDLDVAVPLGSFGNPAAGAATPGFNRGIVLVNNQLAQTGGPALPPFLVDLSIFGLLSPPPFLPPGAIDYTDVEHGDWALALPWQFFNKDLGAATSDGSGFFTLDKVVP